MHTARLISDETIIQRLEELRALGVDLDHIPLDLTVNQLFAMEVDDLKRRTSEVRLSFSRENRE